MSVATINGLNRMSVWDETFYNLIDKEDGYFRIKAVEDRGIYRFEAYRFLGDDSNLRKVAKGVYATKDTDVDWDYIIQLRAQRAVISHESALYLHGIVPRPYQVSVTVPQGYNFSRLRDKGVKIMTCNKDLLDYGMVEVETPQGHNVRTYNMHRTMVDVLRKAKYLPDGVLAAAEAAYYGSSACDPEILIEFADHFHARKRVEDSLQRNGIRL